MKFKDKSGKDIAIGSRVEVINGTVITPGIIRLVPAIVVDEGGKEETQILLATVRKSGFEIRRKE